MHCTERERETEERAAYGEDEAVLEVGKLFVALLAAEHAVLLVHHLLVAVLAGTGLIQAVLLAQVDNGCNAGVVVGLKGRRGKENRSSLCTLEELAEFLTGMSKTKKKKHFRNAWKNSTQEIFITKYKSDRG